MAPFVSLHAAREADFRCGLDAQSTVTERGCVSCPVQAECFMNHMVPGCTHARKCETDAIWNGSGQKFVDSPYFFFLQ